MAARILFALSATLLIAPLQLTSALADEANCGGGQYCKSLGSFSAFSEMVGSGVKKLALSSPMSPEEMDAFVADAGRVAAEYGVEIYREPQLLVTDLFPADVAEGKDVLLIYKGSTLDEYLALKKIKQALVASDDYHGEVRAGIARMFGHLLSYPDHVIEKKIRETTD